MQSMVKHHTVSFSLLEHRLSIGITVVLVTGTNDFYTNLGTRGAALTESRNYFVTAQQRRQSKRIASLSIGRNNFTLHFRDESGAAVVIFILFPFLRYIGFNNMYWTIIYLWSNCLLIHLWNGILITYFMWFYLVH